MKNSFIIFLLSFFISSVAFADDRYWVSKASSTTGNWSDINNWSNISAGPGGFSVPQAGDMVYFNGAMSSNRDCTLDIDAAFDGLEITYYTGTIDLNGFSFNPTVGGTADFIVENGSIIDTPATPGVSMGPGIVISTSGEVKVYSSNNDIIISAKLDVKSPHIQFRSVTFNGKVIAEKTVSTSSSLSGNCIYNSETTFINSSSSAIELALYGSSVFNGKLYLYVTGSGKIEFRGSGVTEFNEDIEINSSGTGGIHFGKDNNSVLTLATEKTITVGTSGFNAGTLKFQKFTQLGNKPQSITLTGTGFIEQIKSDWGGNVNFKSPRFETKNTTYKGTATLEKSGAGEDYSLGGNVFEKDATLISSGSDRFYMGRGNPDKFKNLTLNNIGKGSLAIAEKSLLNEVMGDLTVNQSLTNTSNSSSTGTYISGVLSNASFASSINISKNVILNVNGTGSWLYLGYSGSVNVGGNLTAVNSHSGGFGAIVMSELAGSSLNVAGLTDITISSTVLNTKSIFLGRGGKVVLGNDVKILVDGVPNSNSLVSFGTGLSSEVDIKENIVLENVGLNTISTFNFGTDGANPTGKVTLADTKTIKIGNNGFETGNLRFGNFTQIGNTSQTLTLLGTSLLSMDGSEWGGFVDFASPHLKTKNTKYRKGAILEKTGPSFHYNYHSYGGNTFYDDTKLYNSGSGEFYMGLTAGDIFDADVEMINTGSSDLIIAFGSPNNSIGGNLEIYNYSVAATPTSEAIVGVCNTANSKLEIRGNANIINIGNTNTSTVHFAYGGETILNGNLTINHSPTGANGLLRISDLSTSDLIVNGTTNLNFNETGGISKYTRIAGGTGTVTFNNDVFIKTNANAIDNKIGFAGGHLSKVYFNGNIVVESINANTTGLFFGGIYAGESYLADGKTISLGAGGFSAGMLAFNKFYQIGTTPQAITLTNTASMRQYESNWGGAVDFISPTYTTLRAVYQGITRIEKTGATNDGHGLSLSYTSGGNVFDSKTTLINNGSGDFYMGTGLSDTWNANLSVLSEGEGNVHIANSSPGNMIKGDLELISNSIGTTSSSSPHSVTLSNVYTSTLTVLGNSTVQNNSTASHSRIVIGYSGDVVLSDLTMNNNSTSNAEIILAKSSNSQVTINGVSNITNSALGSEVKSIYLGRSGSVEFNGTLNLHNSANYYNSAIYLNYRVASDNLYNGNIVLNCASNSSRGVFFGYDSGTGTLAEGHKVSIGTDDFLGYNLLFKNFTQLGGTPQVLIPNSINTKLEIQNSEWNGPVNFVFPQVISGSSLYNSDAILHLSGVGLHGSKSLGGNVFNGNTIIQNSGSTNTIYFETANGLPNDFNGDVTYKNIAGIMKPDISAKSTYAKSITIDSPNKIVEFAKNPAGQVILDGTDLQNISTIGSTPMPSFGSLKIDKPTDHVILNTPIEIVRDIDLVHGIINNSSGEVVSMIRGSQVLNVSDTSFVNGPVSKKGETLFKFPVGRTDVYRPIEISAPGHDQAQYRAEYFSNDVVDDNIPDLPVDISINHISDCEYWILDRESTNSPIKVKLYFKDFAPNNCSGVNEPAEVVVSRYDGTKWQNHGNGAIYGPPNNGWVESLDSLTYFSPFSPFTIATTTANNPLPIELTEFKVEKQGTSAIVNWTTASELNNDYFDLERSTDGYNFESIAIVDGAGNSTQFINYQHLDRTPKSGINYYRLKQVDFDGEFTYSDIKSAAFEAWDYVNIYPNPLTKGHDLTISSSEVISKIEIINETGQLIFNANYTEDENQIKLNDLRIVKGIYFVKVYSQANVEVEKLIVR